MRSEIRPRPGSPRRSSTRRASRARPAAGPQRPAGARARAGRARALPPGEERRGLRADSRADRATLHLAGDDLRPGRERVTGIVRARSEKKLFFLAGEWAGCGGEDASAANLQLEIAFVAELGGR